MARLVTPPPESTPAEWGKRLAYLACVLIPVLLLVVLLLNDRVALQSFRWDQVQLTSTPPMSREEFLREVKAIGAFGDTLPVAEPGFLDRLRQAAIRHEWVESVSRVAITGQGTLQLDLTFRTPVARLERSGQIQLVDRYGKLFTPFPKLAVQQLIPLVGWEDRTNDAMQWLPQAGQLASQLQNELSTWKIVSLHLVRNKPLDLVELHLKTQAGTSIIWQTLHGSSLEEPMAEEKLSSLRLYFERYGNLDAPPGQVLDVRRKEGLQRRAVGP